MVFNKSFPNFLLSIISRLGFIFSDKLYITLQYRLTMGQWPDLDNPMTFNEKLQWLKLNNRKPEYTTMVDKYAVKDYVAKVIGERYIIPTLGLWNKPEEIDWNLLPEQFVLKCTHDSGGLVICKDKYKLDKEAAIAKIKKSLSTDYYKMGREWPYKNVQRRIIAEQYLEPDALTHDLPDYKFFCFHGVVKMVYVATGRQEGVSRIDFFDNNFKHLQITQGQHQNALITPVKPKHYDEMLQLAEKLSQNIPHVRVDFYEVNNRVYFGELTFFSQNGTAPFHPEEWDYRIGEWLDLKEIK